MISKRQRKSCAIMITGLNVYSKAADKAMALLVMSR